MTRVRRRVFLFVLLLAGAGIAGLGVYAYRLHTRANQGEIGRDSTAAALDAAFEKMAARPRDPRELVSLKERGITVADARPAVGDIIPDTMPLCGGCFILLGSHLSSVSAITINGVKAAWFAPQHGDSQINVRMYGAPQVGPVPVVVTFANSATAQINLTMISTISRTSQVDIPLEHGSKGASGVVLSPLDQFFNNVAGGRVWVGSTGYDNASKVWAVDNSNKVETFTVSSEQYDLRYNCVGPALRWWAAGCATAKDRKGAFKNAPNNAKIFKVPVTIFDPASSAQLPFAGLDNQGKGEVDSNIIQVLLTGSDRRLHAFGSGSTNLARARAYHWACTDEMNVSIYQAANANYTCGEVLPNGNIIVGGFLLETLDEYTNEGLLVARHRAGMKICQSLSTYDGMLYACNYAVGSPGAPSVVTKIDPKTFTILGRTTENLAGAAVHFHTADGGFAIAYQNNHVRFYDANCNFISDFAVSASGRGVAGQGLTGGCVASDGSIVLAFYTLGDSAFDSKLVRIR
ncbi:hypothetical protein BH10PLA2_BH10PLA2_19990 [soil metagenome]